MFRRLYDGVIALAAHPRALWALAAISFIESSVFPIPPDVLMIPMIIARPRNAFLIATVATVSSVLGGLLGYGIGALAFDQVGQSILAFYGLEQGFEEFRTRYNEWGIWAVILGGVTPFPYKVITIVSGVTQMNLVVFTLASVFARGLRFFIVAALLWKFGAPIRDFIERRLGLMFLLLVVIFILGFWAVKYL